MNKKILIFLFIYIVLEGALRKWFLPEYSNFIFIFKDILLLLLFISITLINKTKKQAASFLPETNKFIWLTFFAMIFFYGLIVRPDSLTIIGWRYYLISIPLIVLIPLYFYRDIEKYSYYYLLFSIPVLLLGVYQYFNPSDSIINKYAWLTASDKIAAFGDNRPRITSTFSYISPYTIYLQTLFLLGWLMLIRTKSKKRIVIISSVIFIVFINLIMTGSRGPVLVSTILSLPFIYHYLIKSRNRFVMALLVGGFIFLSVHLLFDPFSALAQRSERAGDTEIRVLGALMSPLVTFASTDVIGYGVGKTFLGTGELSQKNPTTIFDEVNQDRVGVEIGIFGYLFVLFIKIYFMFKTYKLIKKANSSEIKYWSLFSICIQLSSVWAIPFYNSIAATFYFTAIGIYYLMRYKQIKSPTKRVVVKN